MQGLYMFLLRFLSVIYVFSVSPIFSMSSQMIEEDPVFKARLQELEAGLLKIIAKKEEEEAIKELNSILNKPKLIKPTIVNGLK